jgi:hypothetical protein
MLQQTTRTKAAIVKRAIGQTNRLIVKPALALDPNVTLGSQPKPRTRKLKFGRFRRQLRVARGTSSLTLWLWKTRNSKRQVDCHVA